VCFEEYFHRIEFAESRRCASCRMPSFGACGVQTGNLLQAERSGGFGVVSEFHAGSQFFEGVSSCSQCRVSEDGELRGTVLLPSLRPKSSKFRFVSRSFQSVDRTGHGGIVAMAMGSGRNNKGKEAGDSQALDTNWGVDLRSNQSAPIQSDADASWEHLSMAFRIAYSTAMYGGLAFAGHVICGFTGVDLWGGFNLCSQVITTGFGYAVPPMMALLFILEDEIVKTWSPARAIRDVEDEELLDFFSGMSLWQFPFIVAAGAVAEELFFRVAIQGGLTHALQMSDKGVTDSTIGLASLTGVIPLFVPFAQFFATALTAAMTSSMYYVMTSPKDPKYVVAPVVRGRNNREDIKERVSAWYERRQQKKIYSPLMEGLLAMYLGFEWMHTGNILAPIITHTLYSLVIVGNGLRRIHDNREKLRQRVSKISVERLARIGVMEKSRPE
jgi:membrane protease YdiL (CAAX protease family)